MRLSQGAREKLFEHTCFRAGLRYSLRDGTQHACLGQGLEHRRSSVRRKRRALCRLTPLRRRETKKSCSCFAAVFLGPSMVRRFLYECAGFEGSEIFRSHPRMYIGSRGSYAELRNLTLARREQKVSCGDCGRCLVHAWHTKEALAKCQRAASRAAKGPCRVPEHVVLGKGKTTSEGHKPTHLT